MKTLFIITVIVIVARIVLVKFLNTQKSQIFRIGRFSMYLSAANHDLCFRVCFDGFYIIYHPNNTFKVFHIEQGRINVLGLVISWW